MTFELLIVTIPYEIWSRELAKSGLSWEQFYATIPTGVVLLPYAPVKCK